MNINAISDTIQRALKSAGLDPRSQVVQGVETTIRNALSAAGLARAAPVVRPKKAAAAASPASDLSVIDMLAPGISNGAAAEPAPPLDTPALPGQFIDRSFFSPAGSRRYKLFVPSSYADDQPMPLIVMLHGCQQHPDDFAAGTRMNELAQAHGFLVAYPAQSANANGSNCWNWFNSRDQARDGGEASIIAGIALQVADGHAVDRQRIFVAGLSAGAAMAVILGVTHPDVFSAVGAHSGLPYEAAHDVASAFAAMSRPDPMRSRSSSKTAMPPGLMDGERVGIPTIVFHGDRDTTVVARNGWAIVDQARSTFAANKVPLHMSVTEGVSPTGGAFTTTRFADAEGHRRVEHWLLHGGAHAWSGGSPKGSYTAENGPSASAEMVRFFLAQ